MSFTIYKNQRQKLEKIAQVPTMQIALYVALYHRTNSTMHKKHDIYRYFPSSTTNNLIEDFGSHSVYYQYRNDQNPNGSWTSAPITTNKIYKIKDEKQNTIFYIPMDTAKFMQKYFDFDIAHFDKKTVRYLKSCIDYNLLFDMEKNILKRFPKKYNNHNFTNYLADVALGLNKEIIKLDPDQRIIVELSTK